MFEQLEDVEMTKNEFKQLPEGNYTATLTHVEFESDMFQQKAELEFTINEGEFKARKVWINLTQKDGMSENAKRVVKTQICKLLDKDSTKGIDVKEAIANSVGNHYELYCKPREYNGKTYTQAYINELVPF